MIFEVCRLGYGFQGLALLKTIWYVNDNILLQKMPEAISSNLGKLKMAQINIYK